MTELRNFKVTNLKKAPYTISMPHKGHTIRPGEPRVVGLDEQTYYGLMDDAVQHGILRIDEPDEETSVDDGVAILPGKVIEAVEPSEALEPEEEVVDENAPKHTKLTHVKHSGFGRWHGYSGDEKITDAMTKTEAQAYAAEHEVPMGGDPDPVAGDVAETEPEAITPAPDNQAEGE